MWRRNPSVVVMLTATILVGVGQSSAEPPPVLLGSESCGDCWLAKDPPSTLFAWRTFHLGTAQPGPEEEVGEWDPISTDRPGFTNTSSTVGKGVVQLEMGYCYTFDESAGVRTQTHFYPESIWRIGVLVDWLELRIGWTYANAETTGGGVTIRPSGSRDLRIGCKLALTEQEGLLPAMAIIPVLFVPTGSRAFTAAEVRPAIDWVYSLQINDCINLGGSSFAMRERDATGRFYALLAQSAAASFQLTQRLGTYAEWFVVFPHGAIEPGLGAEHVLDGGFLFLLTENVQLDLEMGVGLNEGADDLFAGGGLSIRW